MKLREILYVFCLFASGCVLAQKSSKNPNIIFILADDMGYSDMSWQNSDIETPNLDKLRSDGMFLQRNYVQPQCTPSRVAFLTGNYPYRYGLHEHIVLPWSLTGIPNEEKTIAEKMQEAGYETAIVGKWHVGSMLESYLPQNQGFDHSMVCINGAISYWNYTHYGRSDIIKNGVKYYAPSTQDNEASGNQYVTNLWRDEAIKIIEQKDKNKPLFMYLSFTAPHFPLQATKETSDKYEHIEVDEYWPPVKQKNNKRFHKSRRGYMALVDDLDQAIGKVIKSLKDEGIYDNTLIVFSSDNGGIPEADNRPFRSVKGDSFEGGVRVPGIAVWPNKIKPNSKSSELVYIADWYATFAEVAGLATKDEGKDAVSALPVLVGEKGKRVGVPIISAGRHAFIDQNYSLVGGGEDYNLLVDSKFSNFTVFDINNDEGQKKGIYDKAVKSRMADSLATHFSKTNRGYFNWDIKYTKDRLDNFIGDHNYDNVIQDIPKVTVHNKNVTIAPVSKFLNYNLLASNNNKDWTQINAYTSRKNQASYTFVSTKKKYRYYKVQTALHYGLPANDGFSLEEDGYKLGAFESDDKVYDAKKILPKRDGFLQLANIKGGNQIAVVENSLKYKNWPTKGGALNLKKPGDISEVFLDMYLMEPINKGKLYASMLVKFDGSDSDTIGEVNWLRRNGNKESIPLSLIFEPDGIYIDQTDTVDYFPKTKISDYKLNETVCVVFEFNLGATGHDDVKVYINPNKTSLPLATLKGEFTIDKLQFKLNSRVACEMTVDEINVARNLKDVLY